MFTIVTPRAPCHTDQFDMTRMPARSWSTPIVDAIGHYAKWQTIGFRRRADTKAVDMIAQLQEGIVAPKRKRNARARSDAAVLKKASDGDKLERVAPPGEIKAAVRAAMIDLAIIAIHFKSASTMPPRAKQVTNAIVVGILFNNQLGGRSEERTCMFSIPR